MKEISTETLIIQDEAIRLLGYGKEKPGMDILEALNECAKKLRSVLIPKYYFKTYNLERFYDSKIMEQDVIRLKGTEFILSGKSITRHLENCEKAVLCCATLSKGVDRLIESVQNESMLDSLLLDALSNAAVEQLRSQMEKEVAEQNKGYTINWMFGIGYGDLSLNLQKPFLQLLDAGNKIGLYVNSSSLLIPLKSVTGVIGLKETNL